MMISVNMSAQSNPRVEHEFTRDKYVEYSGPMGEKKAFVSFWTAKPVNKKQEIEFVFYDQQLKETNRVDAAVNVGEKFQAYYSDSNGVYAVYAKTLSGDYTLLYCDGKEVKTVTGTFGSKGYCRSIYGQGRNVVMECKDKSSNSFVVTANVDAGQPKLILLNGTDTKADISITAIQKIQLTNEIVVVYELRTKDSGKLQGLFLDANLAEKRTVLLSQAANKEKFLMTASFTASGADDYMVSGTYQNEKGDYSNGMYMGRLKAGVWEKNNYYSWTKDFTHFTDFLTSKQKGKVEKKKDKAESKGDEYDMDVLMLTHPLYKINGTYILVGEIYYPEYQTYTDSKGVTTRTFVGYRYQQALIAGFDENLDKKWDQSFAIGRLGGFIAEEIINVAVTNQQLSLFFANGNTVQSKVFAEDGKVVSENTTTVAVADEGEEVRAMYLGETEHWHNDIFLSTGAAKTKDNRSGDKQTIFYMTIVTLDKKK